MKAFESYGDKSFSLLDTPGQNEARASEALMKLGPQIMKHSSGCILCVPWQQVDATQQMPVFDYVNRSMRGKRVIVIVTLWDSFKDTAADAPQNMIDNILSYFNTDMRPNVTIHLTSGHKMLCFMKLERLLLEHEALGSNEATLLSAVGESDFAIDLSNPVTGGGYLSRSLWSKQSFLDFVSNTRTELKSEEVIQSFRTLYDEAELLAIQGHIATLDSAHSRWLKSFETLKLFVSSSGEKREAIQKKLLQTSETYKAVVDEMSSLPGKVTDAVRNHLNELIGKGLMTFAESMRNWKVVIERSDGSIEEREEISFPGGKAEVRMWIESPRCKGKLVSFMKQPTKLQLEAARSCLPGVIKEMYTKCGDLVEMISTVSDGTADAMRDMQIFFRKIPVVDFNVDLYVDTVCQMDAKQITFREERSHCVIVNETFKIEVYDLFKRSFQDAISLISATLFADLDHIFTDFSKLVSTELQTVEKIYMRNQEFLQQQLDAADLEQILTSVDRDNTVFTDDLMELKKSLLHPPGSASTPTPIPADPSAAAASVPYDSTTLPPPPELVPSLNRQLSFIGKIVSIRNVERDSYLSQDISLNLSVSSSPSVDFCKWCLETSTDGSLTVMNSQTEQYLLADCDYLSLSHEGDVISEPNSKMLWNVIPNTDSQHDSFFLTPALRPGMRLTLDEFGNLVLVNYTSPAGFWTIAVAE